MKSNTLKLADGLDYGFVRESPFAVKDSEIHDKLLAVNNLLDFSEQLALDVRLRNAQTNISRTEVLLDVCQDHLLRDDLQAEKEDLWREKLDQCFKILEKAEREQASIVKEASELSSKCRELTMDVARWAIMKQHGKTEVDADCLLTVDIATDVCAVILGRHVFSQVEDESPLSETPAKKDNGSGK